MEHIPSAATKPRPQEGRQIALSWRRRLAKHLVHLLGVILQKRQEGEAGLAGDGGEVGEVAEQASYEVRESI